MSASISRAQFLRGDFTGRVNIVRPPWATVEELFLEACDGCGDCLRVCPEQILRVGRAAYPEVDFTRGGCSFCGDCVRACSRGALDESALQPWGHRVAIVDGCLALQGVECRSCGDQCEPRAIRFRPRVGAVARPQLDMDDCNGCGACISACPASALRIVRGPNIKEGRIDE